MMTNLGKELRKLRIELGLKMHDMATAIGISDAMLSSIETGKKPAPDYMIERLAAVYDVIRDNRSHFSSLAAQTQKTVRIDLDERADASALAVAFARNYPRLSSDDIRQMMAVLDKLEQPQ